jgi:hypothetical protein
MRDPAQRVRVQGWPAPFLPGLCVALDLDRPRLGKRGRELLALASTATVYGDILRATTVDAWVACALEQHAGCCLVPTPLPILAYSSPGAEALQTRISAGIVPLRC